MKQLNMKKLVLLNLPYFLLGLFATNLGEAWRLAVGADASAVLPRVGSRRAWLAGKLAHLAFFSAVFTLLGELASGMALLVLGCGADASGPPSSELTSCASWAAFSCSS